MLALVGLFTSETCAHPRQHSCILAICTKHLGPRGIIGIDCMMTPGMTGERMLPEDTSLISLADGKIKHCRELDILAARNHDASAQHTEFVMQMI